MTIQTNTTRARETCSVTDCRSTPDDHTTARRCKRHDALLKLASWLRPGDKVWTVLKHVSRSGLSRSIAVVMVDPDEGPVDISGFVARAIGARYDGKHGGVVMHDTGVDSGWELVHSLSTALHGYGLEQRWLT